MYSTYVVLDPRTRHPGLNANRPSTNANRPHTNANRPPTNANRPPTNDHRGGERPVDGLADFPPGRHPEGMIMPEGFNPL